LGDCEGSVEICRSKFREECGVTTHSTSPQEVYKKTNLKLRTTPRSSNRPGRVASNPDPRDAPEAPGTVAWVRKNDQRPLKAGVGKAGEKPKGGRERVGPIGRREARDNNGNRFPRSQRFPNPWTRQDRRREYLENGIAEGREERRGVSKIGRRD